MSTWAYIRVARLVNVPWPQPLRQRKLIFARKPATRWQVLAALSTRELRAKLSPGAPVSFWHSKPCILAPIGGLGKLNEESCGREKERKNCLKWMRLRHANYTPSLFLFRRTCFAVLDKLSCRVFPAISIIYAVGSSLRFKESHFTNFHPVPS